MTLLLQNCLNIVRSETTLRCVDLDLGSSPGWWAVTVATYCPSGWWNIPNLCQRNVVADLTPKTVMTMNAPKMNQNFEDKFGTLR